jgi:acetyl-CoA synthetase
LLDVPAVAETAAIGVDDALKGQQLIVFVVPRDSSVAVDKLERDVADRIANRLGKPFRPARVHVVAQLPKTRSLKIMRRVIRNLYTNRPVGDLSSLDNPAALKHIRTAAGIGDEIDLES